MEASKTHRGWVAIALLVLVAYNLTPFFWMISTSLKTNLEVLSYPATLIPRGITLRAYEDIWVNENFGLFFLNSVITSGSTALLSSAFGIFAAYGFSRFRFPGKLTMMVLLIGSQMLPGILLVGPYFEVLSILGLYDTRFGLVMALTTITLPFSVWMLKGYVDTIPVEVDQAAMIDGASDFQILGLIVLPNILPGLVATMTFAFLLAWSDVLWALCLIHNQHLQPMTLGVLQLAGQFRMDWSQIMAATVMASAIPAIFYVMLQRYLVHGFASSAVKD